MYVYRDNSRYSTEGTGRLYYVDDQDWRSLCQHFGTETIPHVFSYICIDDQDQGYLFLCDHRYYDFVGSHPDLDLKKKSYPDFSFHDHIGALDKLLVLLRYINDSGTVLKEIPGLPVKIGSHIELGYQSCHNPRFCIRECPIDGFEREDLLEYLDGPKLPKLPKLYSTSSMLEYFHDPRINLDRPDYSSMSREELLEEVRKEFEENENYDSFGDYVYDNLIDHYSEELCPIYYCDLDFCFVGNNTKVAEF